MSPLLLVVLGLIVLGGGWLVLTYNSLVQTRNRADEAWSDIEVQMKRRYDLIPNLVEAVKGYAKHEEGVFTKVTEARSVAMGATTPAQHAAAENMLSSTLKSMFAVAEAYPALRAAESFMHLQTELSDAEDKIQAARRFFNGNVRDLNTAIQSFPTNVIANAFGFTKREFFDAPDVVNEPVKISF